MQRVRYLGIDHGDKRIGLAVSDTEGSFAFPLKTISNRGRRALKDIKKLVEAEKISGVVIGIPVAADGSETKQAQKVRDFAKGLRREIAPDFYLENELLTSRLVGQAGIKKKHADKSAAALILQAYLDKLNEK